jgi:predicted membrane-bound spermidine synthase
LISAFEHRQLICASGDGLTAKPLTEYGQAENIVAVEPLPPDSYMQKLQSKNSFLSFAQKKSKK